MPSSSPPAIADLEQRLDAQMLNIQNEIAKLRAHKSRLSSALLGSSKIRKHVERHKSVHNPVLQEKLELAIAYEKKQNDIKIYRLAHGVTAFPFTDPAPERAGEPAMLGVRFDLAPYGTTIPMSEEQRQGVDKQDSNLIVMLRRAIYNEKTYLTIASHTIPGHIDLEAHTDQYLPLPDGILDGATGTDGELAIPSREESFQDDSGIDVTQDIQLEDVSRDVTNNSAVIEPAATRIEGNGQDLHKFISCVRDDLTSWHYRTKSIAHLRHEIGLHPAITTIAGTPAHQDNDVQPLSPDRDISSNTKFNIFSLEQETNDARRIKIIWKNGALALLRIHCEGHVEQAVVYAPTLQTGSSQESVSSAPENDDDSHNRRVRDQRTARIEHGQENVRLHDVERKLMTDEDCEKVMIPDLARRLKVCHEQGSLFAH